MTETELEKQLKIAYGILFKRYNNIAQVNKDKLGKAGYKILFMGITCISNPEKFTAEKMSRWLGFVQGILWQNGFLDIDEERNFSRPILHRVYKDLKVQPPESIDIQEELVNNWGES